MSSVQAQATGDQALPSRWLSGLDVAVQRLRTRLSTVRGTWPDDDSVGLPFDRWIERPTTATAAIVGAAIQRQIEADPAVRSVSVVSTTVGRVVTVTATAIVQADGESGTLTVTMSPLLTTGAPALFAITGRTSPGSMVG